MIYPEIFRPSDGTVGLVVRDKLGNKLVAK